MCFSKHYQTQNMHGKNPKTQLFILNFARPVALSFCNLPMLNFNFQRPTFVGIQIPQPQPRNSTQSFIYNLFSSFPLSFTPPTNLLLPSSKSHLELPRIIRQMNQPHPNFPPHSLIPFPLSPIILPKLPIFNTLQQRFR